MTSTTDAAGRVETVLGAISPDLLGVTLMHEHILCDVTPPELAAEGREEYPITLETAFEIRYHWCRHYGNQILDSVETAIGEVSRFGVAGGSAIVELTTAGMKPDPAGLRRIARETGVHIVLGTGYYVESFARPFLQGRSVEELAAAMIGDLTTGFGDTGVRAGIIGEIGVSDPWTDLERAALEAAAIAQRQTGATINVHPGRERSSPLAIARFLRACGGDTERLVISHMDRTLFDEEDILPVLDEGCVVEWDFFGIESSYYPFAPIDLPNDGQRLNLIRRLFDRGYGRQITISQDICTRTRLVRWGGHGYAHLIDNVVPMMRAKGFSQGEIDQLLIDTPRRLLTLP